MKHLAFALLCLPCALFGALLALAFWSWPIGCVGAGFMMGMAWDLLFPEYIGEIKESACGKFDSGK